MTKQSIIEKVKVDYECVLVDFKTYDSAMALYQEQKDELDVLADEDVETALLDEKNVFKADNTWIYATEWYDAALDD